MPGAGELDGEQKAGQQGEVLAFWDTTNTPFRPEKKPDTVYHNLPSVIEIFFIFYFALILLFASVYVSSHLKPWGAATISNHLRHAVMLHLQQL
jgi:hypothetical protein